MQAAHQDQLGMPADTSKQQSEPVAPRSAAEWAQLIQQLPEDVSTLAATAMQTVQSSSDWQVRDSDASRPFEASAADAQSKRCCPQGQSNTSFGTFANSGSVMPLQHSASIMHAAPLMHSPVTLEGLNVVHEQHL